jgi:hypothetical protein
MGGAQNAEYDRMALPFLDSQSVCCSPVLPHSNYSKALLQEFYRFRNKQWAASIIRTLARLSETLAL